MRVRIVCASVIPFARLNGHTPRKLPAKASPGSNLSLHRISSLYIISDYYQNCNTFLSSKLQIFQKRQICQSVIMYKKAAFFFDESLKNKNELSSFLFLCHFSTKALQHASV